MALCIDWTQKPNKKRGIWPLLGLPGWCLGLAAWSLARPWPPSLPLWIGTCQLKQDKGTGHRLHPVPLPPTHNLVPERRLAGLEETGNFLPSWPEPSPTVLLPPPAPHSAQYHGSSLPAPCTGACDPGPQVGTLPTLPPPRSHIPLSTLANGTAGQRGLLTDRTPVVYAHQASRLPAGSSTTPPAEPAPYMVSVRGGSQAHPSHSEPSGRRDGSGKHHARLGSCSTSLSATWGGVQAWGLR